jgi:3-(3-hydroxy-phenyl)propionate hydroxylase/6-hydroxy-3-succinoylpyridine 3-monooxygenase
MAHIVIVGAGPVGLIAALGLARRGLQVTVLDRGDGPVDAPRAAAYHFPVLEVFDEVGILDDVTAAGIRVTVNNIHVLATGELLTTDLAILQGVVPHPYNINLGQDALSRIALEHLSRLPGARVRWGADVVGIEQDAASATAVLADGSRVTGDWLLGADGARSVVRKAIGLGFEGSTWDDRFIATNIGYDFEAHGYGASNMVLDPDLGCIVAKLETASDAHPHGLWRVTFAEDESLPEDEIPSRIAAFMQRFLPGEPEFELVAFSPYRMHQRSAEAYRVGRVLLAGDAAHVTNPTGALGLTSGILDLDVLMPALAAVIDGSAPDSVLDDYSDARRTKFLEHTSPFASSFKQLVYNGDAAAQRSAFEGWRSQLSTDEGEREFQLGIKSVRSEQVV